ncbi:DUF427-domain-containing protein [Epithele typhae]|uniref:DUF427-domain-containing protein n=1 Tax=Epithele typhae TaxID=378194 RepID=UPI002007B271|nr:DUF427-domain-containing protein [Epithele typhae]KAH9944039.1 DUF427-domain-containing protein [Epithele typhae]
MKVTLNGTVLAESDKTIFVEGNHYFPPESVNSEAFTSSNTHTTCGWKGVASYYNASSAGKTEVSDVAWYYPEPKKEAENIKNYVAFYKNKVSFE